MLDNDQLSALCDRLRQPSTKVRLVRPCTLGDGLIEASPQAESPAQAPLRFVPASGAATRMFQAVRQTQADSLDQLRAQVASDRPDLAPALRAFEGWSGLAMSRALPQVDPSVDLPATLAAIHRAGIAAQPKGLVPFHLNGDTPRTAVEGHLRAAAVGGGPIVRAHFTAPTDHLDAFRAEIDRLNRDVAPGLGVQFQVDLSIQHPDTDTPALRDDDTMVRREDGTPFVRPGGHGALLRNLDSLDGLVRIINIDNLAHETHRTTHRPWANVLVQTLLDLRDAHARFTQEAREGVNLAEIRTWLADFGLHGPRDQAAILADLHRPLRVCAVVPSDGQPGGGPFWVLGEDGRITAQIVEGVEVDDAPDQQAIWQASTHFNPVDIVCWLNDTDGRPHDLYEFVDNGRWIRTRKDVLGAPARCLERPGLWNGSMSGWLTRFVAVPRETFNPVKTLGNLLDERHCALIP